MGSRSQVEALKATKMISAPLTNDAGNSPMSAGVEGRFHDSHEFIFSIDKISQLAGVEGRSWGEGDCFFKYSFPVQTETVATSASQQQPFFPPPLALKTFQTPAVPFVPDSDLGYSNKHSIVLPSSSRGVDSSSDAASSIHRQLLHATAAAQHTIPLELWARFYTPGVTEKLIGKRGLSLEDLRTRVMSGEGADGTGGRFHLRLKGVDASGNVDESAPEVCVVHFRISYLCQRLDLPTPATTEEATAMAALRRFEEDNHPMVPVAVVLHKACGMKTLARVSDGLFCEPLQWLHAPTSFPALILSCLAEDVTFSSSPSPSILEV